MGSLSFSLAPAIGFITKEVEQEKYKIIESDEISVVKELAGKNDAILCDLDNTLFTSKEIIGSSMFWDHIVNKTMETFSINKQSAMAKISKLSKALKAESGIQPVDSNAPKVLSELESEGHIVVGFTARSTVSASITTAQIKEAGYKLKGLGSEVIPLAQEGSEVIASYQSPVVYAGSRLTKGDVLKKLATKVHLTGIVMLDDLRENLESMQQTCKELSIPFTGVRFSKLDPLAKNFPVSKALESLEKFLKSHDELAEEYQYLVKKEVSTSID